MNIEYTEADKQLNRKDMYCQKIKVLLEEALRTKASDIHFSNLHDGLYLQLDIDGQTKTIEKVEEARKRTEFINALKRIAGFEARRDVRQTRAFSLNTLGVRFRCELSPGGGRGEHVSLRMVVDSFIPNLEWLQKNGLTKELADSYKWAISQKKGLILVTGATASGKSTTLQSLMMSYDRQSRRTMTLEDPVERYLEYVNHIDITETHSWNDGMKSLLRMAPKVILIGEIRDNESANFALKAANTGHLVLSTLHTNSVPDTVTRLLDMGVDKRVLADNLLLVSTQELMPKLCTGCRVEKEGRYFRGDGCEKCESKIPGYDGLIAVSEYASQISPELVIDYDKKNFQRHLNQSMESEKNRLRESGIIF